MTGLFQSLDNLVWNAINGVNTLLGGNVGQVLVFAIAVALLFWVYSFAKKK